MRGNSKCLIAAVTVAAVLLSPLRLRLAAQDQPQSETPRDSLATASFNFLIGSGLLCDAGDSTACPAVAKAVDQETMEISGAGTLDLAKKSVTAAGAFTEKNTYGQIVNTGVWMATDLVSFQFYGIAPGALQLEYPKLRATAMGPLRAKGMGGMGGPIAAGGLATVRIRLLPDAAAPTDAILRINCAKGTVPSDQLTDGVRLAIQGGTREFNEVISGRAVFLLRGQGSSSN